MKQLLTASCALLVFAACSARAADESIDRLIGKLPPPEKFIDPAIQDPLNKQIAAAINAHNLGIALDLSRRLANHYPKSVGGQMTHGLLAFSVHQFREASNAYQKAISIRPSFPIAYVGLGFADMAQNRFSAALSDFQRVTRIAPQLDIGWIGSMHARKNSAANATVWNLPDEEQLPRRHRSERGLN